MYDDIEQLLTSHGIKYKKNGHVVKCLCPNPSHNDRHIGSFSFDLKKGLGYCFACGYSVNVRSFNRLLGESYDGNYNYDFLKSLKPKKEEITYPSPIVYGKLYDPKYDSDVMNFLHGIGFSDEFISERQIKYCRYCEMISEELKNDSNERPTVMQNRICIPIYKDGKIVNYECRTFADEFPKVKYVNGCRSNLLYNYDDIDLNETVILTESIKNLGKGWNVCKNIISSFGNQITDVKMEMLNRIPSLIAFLDYDDGGLFMLRKLKEGYEGDLKVTFNPKRYKDADGKIKGKDMNDCTLDEIKFHINNPMSVEKAEKRLNGDNGDSIFWT